MAKKTRDDLKNVFKNGAKPTEDDFADLFDSFINVEDDGIEKRTVNQPLKIRAWGEEEKILELWNHDNVQYWGLKLKSNEKAGLNLTDQDGNNKLFIDHESGSVGIGTTSPKAKLEVAGDIKITEGVMGQLKVTKNTFLATDSGNVGIGTTKPEAKLEVNGTIKASEFKTTLFSVTGTTNVTLSNNNKWANFPDLKLDINLPHAANVIIFYQITMPGGDSHLCTRLSINDNVQKQSRTIIGNIHYWGSNNMFMIHLSKGKHTIAVQYRTPIGGENTPAHDWQTRSLQVLVLGSV